MHTATRITQRLAAAIALLVAATSARAATAPYGESFETYATGADITDVGDGWSSTHADAGAVRAGTPDNLGGFPIPDAEHNQVLELQLDQDTDTLRNEVSTASSGIVVLDLLLKPASRPVGNHPTSDLSQSHVACYVNANNQLVIYHRDSGTPTWLAIGSAGDITAGAWHRLTVRKDYQSKQFQVSVDGGAPLSDGGGATWFDMIDNGDAAMSRVRFEGTETAYVDDLVVTPRTLSYSSTTFREGATPGTITNAPSVVITLGYDAFTGSNGDNFVAAGKVVVANLPPGLTAVAERTSDTTVALSLTGTAAAHAAADSIDDLTLTFSDTAFAMARANDVEGYQRTDLAVDFADSPALVYADAAFSEDAPNDGSVAAGAATLLQETFTGSDGDDLVAAGKVTVGNVPTGLTVSVTRTNAHVASVTFSGNAASHANTDDVANLSIAFLNAAFSGGDASAVSGADRADLAIDFFDPTTLTYSSDTFTELSLGAINNLDPVVISLNAGGDVFATGSEFVGEGKVTVANLPASLSAEITRLSDTELSVALTGTADSHDPADDVSNLTFTFTDAAFARLDADVVTNYLKSNLNIAFNTNTLHINTVDYTEPFEDPPHTAGSPLTASNHGWSPGTAADNLVIDNSGADGAVVDAVAAYPKLPLPAEDHTQVLRVTDQLTNEVRSASGGIVYSDLMVYFTPLDSTPAPNADYQVGLYVNAAKQLVVWYNHGGTNDWRTVASPTVPPAEIPGWHRVVVVQDYANRKFRIFLDRKGTLVNPTAGGSWFDMPATANNFMSRLRIHGGTDAVPAYLDDLSITTSIPDITRLGTVIRFK